MTSQGSVPVMHVNEHNSITFHSLLQWSSKTHPKYYICRTIQPACIAAKESMTRKSFSLGCAFVCLCEQQCWILLKSPRSNIYLHVHEQEIIRISLNTQRLGSLHTTSPFLITQWQACIVCTLMHTNSVISLTINTHIDSGVNYKSSLVTQQ